MRRTTLALLVVLLVVVLGAAELIAPRVVERVIAERVQRSAGLPASPDVEARGRPFLLQALRGRYDDISVRAAEVPGEQVELALLDVRLTGVRVPLGAALSRSVGEVPVDAVSTRAVVGYDELTALVADRGLQVTPAGEGLVRVTGQVEVLGRTLRAAAVSRPTVDDGTLVVRAERFEVGSGVADRLVSRAVGDRFDVRVALEPLPYGLVPGSLTVEPGGVVLLADAGRTVLPGG